MRLENEKPPDVCQIVPKCSGRPTWWLVDQKENGQFKACSDCKDKFLSERFKAEKRLDLPMLSKIMEGFNGTP